MDGWVCGVWVVGIHCFVCFVCRSRLVALTAAWTVGLKVDIWVAQPARPPRPVKPHFGAEDVLAVGGWRLADDGLDWIGG